MFQIPNHQAVMIHIHISYNPIPHIQIMKHLLNRNHAGCRGFPKKKGYLFGCVSLLKTGIHHDSSRPVLSKANGMPHHLWHLQQLLHAGPIPWVDLPGLPGPRRPDGAVSWQFNHSHGGTPLSLDGLQ